MAGAAGGTAGGGGGGQACGPSTCGGANPICCNASCGICTATGVGCIQIACPADAGITLTDGGACYSVPARDAEQCSGDAHAGAPHFYVCLGPMLGPPCVIRSIGDLTNTFCCP